MKSIKMLGLTAFAAMALMALVGVSSAVAQTALCKTSEDPCAPGNRYAAGTKFNASLLPGSSAVFASNAYNLTCSKSAFTGSTSGEVGEPLAGQVTSFSWSGCKTSFGTNCTFAALGVPYSAGFAGNAEGSEATLTIGDGGRGNPRIAYVCGAYINCTYEFTEFSMGVDGGGPATLTASQVPLANVGFGPCQEELALSAEYVLTAPNPLYVAST